MSGVAGAPERTVVGDWSRLPLRCVLPLARMAAGRQLLWLDDESGDRILTWAATAADGALLCVVSMVWPSGALPGRQGRECVEKLAEHAGWSLCRLAEQGLPGEELPVPWLAALLDAIPIPAALLFPIRDTRGRVVEFRIDRCNGQATSLLGRTPEQITGRGLLEEFPGLSRAGIFDAYVKVVETGAPLDQGPFPYEEPFHGVRYPALLSVRARRMGGGLLVSWQFHDDQARMAARIDDAERLVNLGWMEWNLVTGEIAWTRGAYDVVGLPPTQRPLSLDRLASRVWESDRPLLLRAVKSLSERPGPVTFEVRAGGEDRPRHVSVTAELVRDSLGNLIAVHGVLQDVSAARRMEAELEASRREADRRRLRMAEELQLALLPRQYTSLPGLRTAVRYRPAEHSARVGGDWFETGLLPDGRVLIAIGDVSGHGLQAAAGMAQLRNAMLGIAHTGADAAEILQCLNQLAYHSPEEAMTATAMVGHFQPDERTFSWARGGHPSPILVREGEAGELDNPHGVSLGATPEPGYRLVETRLQPQDRIILYTDGLVERRDEWYGERLDRLLDAARRGARGDPDEHLQTVLSALDSNPEDDTCVIVIHVRS